MTKEVSGMSMEELLAESTVTREQIEGMEPEKVPQIGKYGRMAMEYLKTTDPGRLSYLIMSGQHWETFMEVDKAAYSLLGKIEAQLRRQPPPRTQNGDLPGAGAVREPDSQHSGGNRVGRDRLPEVVTTEYPQLAAGENPAAFVSPELDGQLDFGALTPSEGAGKENLSPPHIPQGGATGA